MIYLASGYVELPDLRGEPAGDAQDILNDLQLTYRFGETVPSGDYPADTIAWSDPGSGLIPYDTRVTLTVSSGPPPTEEPTTEEPTTRNPTTEEPDHRGTADHRRRGGRRRRLPDRPRRRQLSFR